MTIEKNLNGAELNVKVIGRLDTVTAPQLEAEFKGNINGIEKLVLDFDGEEREFVPEDEYVHTEEVDYNEFSFTNMDWKRTIDDCTEIINFGPFGSFSYYCLCRDCKDYSLVADSYTYDSETGVVTLNIIADDAEGVVNTIKIVSYDNEKLVIELGGNVLEFIPG